MFRTTPTLSLVMIAVLTAVALGGCATSGSSAAVPASSDASSAGTTSGPCSGVQVFVDFGILDGEGSSTCVPLTEKSAPAVEIVAAAGLATEGTGTWGDQIVCRVDGLPSAEEPFTVSGHDPYLETCADMPAEFAYWALWQKSSDTADWAYAMEGLGTLTLTKGESLGLVFTTGDATPTPGS
jgi:hypothetical protein